MIYQVRCNRDKFKNPALGMEFEYRLNLAIFQQGISEDLEAIKTFLSGIVDSEWIVDFFGLKIVYESPAW